MVNTRAQAWQNNQSREEMNDYDDTSSDISLPELGVFEIENKTNNYGEQERANL